MELKRLGEDRNCGFYPIIVAPSRLLAKLLSYVRRVQEDAIRAEGRPMAAIVEPTIVNDGKNVCLILERFGCERYGRVQRRIMYRLSRNLQKNFGNAAILIEGIDLVKYYTNKYTPTEIFEKIIEERKGSAV
jgi:hypothetical protein